MELEGFEGKGPLKIPEHWRIEGKLTVDGEPMRKALIVNRREEIYRAQIEIRAHLEVYAAAYRAGERWIGATKTRIVRW